MCSEIASVVRRRVKWEAVFRHSLFKSPKVKFSITTGGFVIWCFLREGHTDSQYSPVERPSERILRKAMIRRPSRTRLCVVERLILSSFGITYCLALSECESDREAEYIADCRATVRKVREIECSPFILEAKTECRCLSVAILIV